MRGFIDYRACPVWTDTGKPLPTPPLLNPSSLPLICHSSSSFTNSASCLLPKCFVQSQPHHPASPKNPGVIQVILTHLCWWQSLPLPFLLLLLIQLSVFSNHCLSLFCFIFPYLSSSAWSVQITLSFSKLLVKPVNYYLVYCLLNHLIQNTWYSLLLTFFFALWRSCCQSCNSNSSSHSSSQLEIYLDSPACCPGLLLSRPCPAFGPFVLV